MFPNEDNIFLSGNAIDLNRKKFDREIFAQSLSYKKFETRLKTRL